MPALRGSLTYARFFVSGELPEDFRQRLMRAIRLRAIQPLTPEDEDLERTGFCRIGDPYAIELGYDDVFWNEYVNLGVRTDRWVYPGSAVRARMREGEQVYKQKTGRDKMGRREKAELKELVMRRMRKQMSPAVSAIDFSWALNEGVVRFFSDGDKAAARMLDLFHRAFGSMSLSLVPEAPYTLADRLGLSKAERSAWDELEPSLAEPDVDDREEGEEA